MSQGYDAIVIGSGPNGFAAAITLARAGLSVCIYEAKSTIGGGMRSAELTLPGFTHDICSAIHPLGFSSPFFRSLPLHQYGLEWIHPNASLAHPFDDGTAILLEKSIDKTAEAFDNDAKAYKNLMKPFVKNWEALSHDLLAPLHFPKHPILMMQFSFKAFQSASHLCRRLFKEEYTRTFFSGLAAHSIQDLNQPLTSSFGLVLGILGHYSGWPFPQGGTQKIANSLAAYFYSLGGKIFTDTNIETMDQLPPSRFILCDVTPHQLVKIAGNRLPNNYKSKLLSYRYGPGVFKIDWALNHPIPWKATECLQAATVHIGGTMDEIIQSEYNACHGISSDKPFIILAQQSLFDSTRAPPGKHTGWGYCHVPHGSSIDMIEKIEAQIERFAPGFKDCILARRVHNSKDLEHYNSNYVGGDINGGIQDFYQLFTRPVARWIPYSTPLKNLYICSSSTPPGGGVHGMCGYHAAQAVLKKG